MSSKTLRMPRVNEVRIAGRLTRDPDLRRANEAVVSENTIAVPYPKKVGDTWTETTSWIRVVAWGKVAETIATECRKGDPVLVFGRLITDGRTDEQGKPIQRMLVLASNIMPLTWPDTPQKTSQNSDNAAAPVHTDSDEEIPF